MLQHKPGAHENPALFSWAPDSNYTKYVTPTLLCKKNNRPITV